MKNILIFGRPRCGKSTLANMIVDKFNYQVIHMDALRDTFKTIYPELNINPKEAKDNEKFQLFLQEYLRRNTKEEERNKYGYVLEGCDISVSDCNKLYNNGKNIIYFLVPLEISAEEFFSNIRKNDSKYDWTYKYSNEQLIETSKKYILEGKQIREECEKYNINCVDTSVNREQKLRVILEEIEQKIKS